MGCVHGHTADGHVLLTCVCSLCVSVCVCYSTCVACMCLWEERGNIVETLSDSCQPNVTVKREEEFHRISGYELPCKTLVFLFTMSTSPSKMFVRLVRVMWILRPLSSSFSKLLYVQFVLCVFEHGLLVETLLLHTMRDRQWQIQATSAKTGDGLDKGLKWILQVRRSVSYGTGMTSLTQ